jgi:hypothetical protein
MEAKKYFPEPPCRIRLCGAEIPNVERIIACMKANKVNLSPGCRSVFDKTSFLPRLAPIS